MNSRPEPIIAYVMKRFPRLTETFILNEIAVMEAMGANLKLFSLMQPEPPPHHPQVSQLRATLDHLPPRLIDKIRTLARAHGANLIRSPGRYAICFLRAAWLSIRSPNPAAVWRQFLRAGFVAHRCAGAGVGLIHAHFANTPGAVAWFASRMSGIPFSFTAHAKDLYLTAPRSLQRRARDARFIATCTGHNVEYLRSILPERDHGKVRLAYHGIDLHRFVRRSAPPPPGEPAFILSVGRLVPKKGHDDLIDALAALAEKGASFACEIVGGGPLHDELQQRIDRVGLAERVKLVGAKRQVELIEHYRRADIFALAPRIIANGDRDGIPNVLGEAMAIGVPVVATAVSGIPELVRNGETGLLVQPNAPDEMAEALMRLIDDPALRAKLADDARAALELNFDCLTTTRDLHHLMRTCACAAAHAETCAPFTSALAAQPTD